MIEIATVWSQMLGNILGDCFLKSHESSVVNIPTADQPFVFSPSAVPNATATTLADDLLQRTRSEITTILREVAALSRQPISFNAYFAAVLDRIVIALAAGGAVLWNTGRENSAGDDAHRFGHRRKLS